jgi:hypothetical protein
MSGMEAFVLRFRELAERETRVVHIAEQPGLPSGSFMFMESFCNDPDCDCRRALITVIRDAKGSEIMATLNYGWESERFYRRWMKGPALGGLSMHGVTIEPFGRQSASAAAFKRLFEAMLHDREYAQRIERHYLLFKGALSERPDPDDAEPDGVKPVKRKPVRPRKWRRR